MAFPAGPYTDGQTYTEGGVTFTYLSATNGWVITSTGSSGGGGGGGGSVGAPTYHGQFTISFSLMSIPGMAFTTTTGPTINVDNLWIDAFASPDNTGFSWSNSTGANGTRNNGGIIISNAGKYRIRASVVTSAGTMQSASTFKTAVLRNTTQVLQGVQNQHYEISSAGGSISHTSYAKQEISGIVNFAAGDVLCFAHHPGSQVVNNPTFRHTIEIESLF